MKSNNTVLVALFAALIVVLSLVPPIPLPAIPVPVTLQTLGAMLAGAMLGPVRGALACLLYLALAAIGLPVLPGGRGGMGAFLGPTGGFLIGMPIGAFVTGWLARRLAGRAPGTWAGVAVMRSPAWSVASRWCMPAACPGWPLSPRWTWARRRWPWPCSCPAI